MSPTTRRQILTGAASIALAGGVAGSIATANADRPHPHSAGRFQGSKPIEPVVLHVFGSTGEADQIEHFALRLELCPNGRLDTFGIDENFQLPAAGPAERFTAAEFVARLIAVHQNPALHETLDMFPGADYDVYDEEKQS